MCVDFANTAAWLDILYSQCSEDDGSIVVVSSKRNSVVSVHPVGSGRRLVDAARSMHGHHGCYLKINLMDQQAMEQRAAKTGKTVVGNRKEVKTMVSLHLDVDAGKGGKYVNRKHALWALGNMPKPPTLVINSNGEAGGFHAYWVLREPVRICRNRDQIQKQCEAWNLRLKELCGGKLDTTCNLDRVLRCVGVPRLDGGRVFMHSYEPSHLYGLEELVA